MKVIVVGLGVQGYKRNKVAGDSVVATVDVKNKDADYKSIQDVPLADYDAVLVCTPDETKLELLTFFLENGKHVLVEKPLLSHSDEQLEELKKIALKNNVVCYTAYNHRFEPHFIRMKSLFDSGQLGKVYAIRMFYGNGTARLVRDSAWRDQAAGVLPDLGSHLLDTLRFWLGEGKKFNFKIQGAYCHENRAQDHVVIGSDDEMSIQLEMMLLSWRNHFTCDVYAEKGSAHIDSLCKWGPSRFTFRSRILPSGRPPEESTILVQDDPTWESEYKYFCRLCSDHEKGNLTDDIWLNRELRELAAQIGIPSVLPEI